MFLRSSLLLPLRRLRLANENARGESPEREVGRRGEQHSSFVRRKHVCIPQVSLLNTGDGQYLEIHVLCNEVITSLLIFHCPLFSPAKNISCF